MKRFCDLDKKDQVAISALRALQAKLPGMGPEWMRISHIEPCKWSPQDWQVIDRDEGLAYLVTAKEMDDHRYELTKGEVLRLLHRQWSVVA